MEGLVLVVALAAFGFVLSYIGFNLDKGKHYFLQVIIIGVVIVTLGTQLPRAAIDYEQECDIVIANETVNGNVTSYEYTQQCEDRTNAPETFAKAGFWFIRIFFAYLFFYLLFTLGKPFMEWAKGRMGRW